MWAGIFADRDSYLGRRSGNANPLVYQLYRTRPRAFFHDITGIGQAVRSNGKFRTRPGYDLVTGIGTPIMAALITGARSGSPRLRCHEPTARGRAGDRPARAGGRCRLR